MIAVSGDMDRSRALKINQEAHAIGRRAGLHKYLEDLTDSRNVESVLGNYQFANHDMMEADVDLAAIVALLVHPDDHTHDFIETTSRNAGLNVTIFRNRHEAVQYLTGLPTPRTVPVNTM
jgi:hypothetical protein